MDNSDVGAVWVFTRNGGVWTQQGPKLIGTDSAWVASYQGSSVAISADGNTFIEGGPNDNFEKGAVWIFTRSGGIWTQQGPRLIGDGIAENSAYQGHSVGISADGNTAIEGGYGDNGDIGAVWVFIRNGGVWTQQGSKLVGTGAPQPAVQGYSVSISSDGNTIIEGGYGDNNLTGAMWIFTRSGSVWTQFGTKLVGSEYTGIPRQGSSVAISSDGNTAITAGYGDNSNTGAVWIFANHWVGITPVSGDVPKDFSLSQNYPNPFNPSTKIRFEVPNKGLQPLVQIRVFDVLGRGVSILVNQQLQPGTYEVNFDGTNFQSGVYFYKLATGDYTETKKMILIK